MWLKDGKLKQAPGTTDPGLFYLQNQCNSNGTAIVKPGFYKGLWKIGIHKTYEALVRVSQVTVIRDYNKDGKLDYNSDLEETGMFGINCHHAGEDSIQIDKWSAGCQAFKRLADFNEFMKNCKSSANKLLDYALLLESDIK